MKNTAIVKKIFNAIIIILIGLVLAFPSSALAATVSLDSAVVSGQNIRFTISSAGAGSTVCYIKIKKITPPTPAFETTVFNDSSCKGKPASPIVRDIPKSKFSGNSAEFRVELNYKDNPDRSSKSVFSTKTVALSSASKTPVKTSDSVPLVSSAVLSIATDSTADKSGTGPIRGSVTPSGKNDETYTGSIGFTLDFKGSESSKLCLVQIKAMPGDELTKFYSDSKCSKTTISKTDSAKFSKLKKGENTFVATYTYKDEKGKQVSGLSNQAGINIDDKDGKTPVMTLTTPPPPAGGGGSGDGTETGVPPAGTGSLIPSVDPGDLSERQLSQRLRTDQTLRDIWDIMRNLANVFVAIFFLVIGFATILHINYDTYGVKKAIMPLIVGIILANFSLLIVQYFVDFAQVLSAGFFNSAAAGNYGDCTLIGTGGIEKQFACNLASTFIRGGMDAVGKVAVGGGAIFAGLVGLLVAFGATGVGTGIAGGAALALIALALLMLLIPTLVVIVLAFLLYVRAYMIIFLAVISPLAWLAIWWTPVQGMFKKWWGQFMLWVFMGPAIMFFLWMAIMFHSKTTPGEANLGTYLLTLVMMYLAVTVPFKMGSQVMAAWGGFGKKAGAVGAGYGYGMLNTKLEAFSKTDLGKRLGITSPRAYISGIKNYYKDRDESGQLEAEAEVSNWMEQGIISRPTKTLRQSKKLKWIFGDTSNENEGIGEVATRSRGRQNQADRKIAADLYEGQAPESVNRLLSSEQDQRKARQMLIALSNSDRTEEYDKGLQTYLEKFGIEGEKGEKKLDENLEYMVDSNISGRNPMLIQNKAKRENVIGNLGAEDLGKVDYRVYKDAMMSQDESGQILKVLQAIKGNLAANGITPGSAQETNLDGEIKRLIDAQTSGATDILKTSINLGKVNFDALNSLSDTDKKGAQDIGNLDSKHESLLEKPSSILRASKRYGNAYSQRFADAATKLERPKFSV